MEAGVDFSGRSKKTKGGETILSVELRGFGRAFLLLNQFFYANLHTIMKVFVHTLVWSDREYLPELFDSLETQSYQDYTLRVLDNASTDGSLEYVQTRAPKSVVARNNKNRGFAGGHNQLLHFTMKYLEAGEDAYVLLLNPDMVLHPDCIGHLVKTLNDNPELAAVQPKVYRAFRQEGDDEAIAEKVQSDVLDTTGLRLNKNFRMTDRGAGELDKGQYDNEAKLFAPSGALVMFRISALRDVMIEQEIFDDAFFLYREDCDLAWRLWRRGWDCAFVPASIAYHYRGMYGAEKRGLLQRLKDRRAQNQFTAALSSRNQLWMLVKNLDLVNFLRFSPWILFTEIGNNTFSIFFEPQTRRKLFEFLTGLPAMLKKRKQIFRTAKRKSSELRTYVS